MSRVSADAIVGPPRALSQPLGSADVMCNANAPVTGDGVPSASGRHVEQPLVEHEAGAVMALLAGLEHEQHPAGEVVAVPRQQPGRADEHRGVGVVAARVHLAVVLRREVEAGVLVQRKGVHVAAQQHRRARLGPRSGGPRCRSSSRAP